MDEIGMKLGNAEDDLSQWYQRSNKDVIALGASALLKRYNNSLSKLLEHVYPGFDWQPWLFDRGPKRLLDDPSIVKRLVSKVEKELQIKEPMEWYRVSIDQLKDLGLAKIFQYHGMVSILKVAYPNMAWNEQFLLGKGFKKAGQRWLGAVLRQLWPKAELVEEYRFAENISNSSSEKKLPMVFDFFFPDLNLAFEFQGLQHYQQLPVYGKVSLRMTQDDAKLSLCASKGITLVQVPFWWTRDKSSLITSILEQRPEFKPYLSQFHTATEATPIPKDFELTLSSWRRVAATGAMCLLLIR